MQKNFEKTFAARTLFCFVLCILIAALSVFKIFTINLSVQEQTVNKSYNSTSFNYGNTRGDIYDCHGFLLTNQNTEYLAVIAPTEKAVKRLNSFYNLQERSNILERLKSNKPILVAAPKLINNDNIYGFAYTNRYDNTSLAKHLIGYINSDNNGVSGIEKSYNEVLYSNESFSVSIPTNAKGEVLKDAKLQFYGKKNNNAVYLTIDKRIQSIAEEMAKPLKKGAVIIAETSTGKIRALLSKPDFEPNNLAAYLNSSDSPLLNRALECYNVGSIFKPCIAVAAIKCGLKDFTYNCSGSCEIDGLTFNCHKNSGHGLMNLNSALSQSCNTYFYNLGINVDKNILYNTAVSFGFISSEKIADGMTSKKGNISSLSELNFSNRLVANFSIGQGNILLSPVSMLNLYNAIANGGSYTKPYVIEKTVVNNEEQKYTSSTINAMDNATSEIIKSALLSVVEEGTGKPAKSEKIMLAGKTATAETGWEINGKTAVHSWFCGFFPYYNPKFTIVVFAENSETENSSCAEIFRLIAEKLKKENLTT